MALLRPSQFTWKFNGAVFDEVYVIRIERPLGHEGMNALARTDKIHCLLPNRKLRRKLRNHGYHPHRTLEIE